MNTPEYSASDIFRQLVSLWRHLGRRRQLQSVLLLGLMLISAFMEVVSLGAVLPFIGIITAPEKLFGHPLVADMAQTLGITSAADLVLPLTAAFAVAALAAGSSRLLLSWCSTRFVYATSADLSIEAYRRTLYQPYRVHVARNSSTVISGILSKIGRAQSVLQATMVLISSVVLIVSIMLVLLVIDAMVAAVVMIVFGASYGLISWLSRRQLQQSSQRIAVESVQVIKALQEGLGGIRDVLLDGAQPLYCDIYRRSQTPLMRMQGVNQFIATSPRFAMEALGMVLIAALAYVLSRHVDGISPALPVLGALALGAQRLLPTLQHGYAAWANIVGNHASLTDALELLDQPLPDDVHQPLPAPLSFQDAIRFDAVRFRYGDDGPWVLDGFNLTIPKGVRIGFVGSTGSGKSTTLDLLMGLLEPTQGRILVDGQTLTGERRRAWQQTIAHVSQSVYLADTTLAENIAFGVPDGAIDMDRVRLAARRAQIADFIESRPEGYHAHVGERGVRLSGGQRQRIGIARALYKQASVLVFDEATSALDNATEQAVMDAIENLNRDLTILLIAHRLTTVRRCDTIIELGHGQVVAQGTYEQLLEHSPSFRDMAKTAVA